MVDRSLYLNMSAAKDVMQSMARIANNIANTNTPGFREDLQHVVSFETGKEAPYLLDDDNNSRAGSKISNFTQGAIQNTGRALDIALDGDGFIAVQTPQGTEAYTRAGNLQLSKDGFLATSRGDLVLGEGGLITISQADRISINPEGRVSAKLQGATDAEMTQLGKVKLVNPNKSLLRKGDDGLFYLPNNETAGADDAVRVIPESIEASNVEPVHALIELIDMARQFEYQTKLMKSIEENSTSSNRLLDVSS